MMNKENNSFLNNECMQVIISLVRDNPNDATLGDKIRKFANNITYGTIGDENQTELELD